MLRVPMWAALPLPSSPPASNHVSTRHEHEPRASAAVAMLLRPLTYRIQSTYRDELLVPPPSLRSTWLLLAPSPVAIHPLLEHAAAATRLAAPGRPLLLPSHPPFSNNRPAARHCWHATRMSGAGTTEVIEGERVGLNQPSSCNHQFTRP